MCSIVPTGFSDHSLLLCNVFIQNILPKNAYWHLNSVLTFDKHFISGMFLDRGRVILAVLGSGGTIVRLLC